jgi:hypothetical protein
MIPVGVLGMTDDERAELFHTGKWAERTVAPNPLPFGGGEVLRDYWRHEGEIRGRREGREEGLREARERMLSALEAPTSERTRATPRRRGRPPSVEAEDDEAMDAIEKAHPGRDDYRQLLKAALGAKYRDMRPTTLNRRSKSAEERRVMRRPQDPCKRVRS